MRYYELHESEYVKRLSRGQQAWEPGEYDAFFMKSYVQRSLARMGHRRHVLRALELGCGTGAVSCFLAERGFDVTGIDVAPTAISFAQQMAASRDLSIRFQATDACREAFPDGLFDLIVDSHLLHCIVFADERHRLLEKVRQALAPDGQFWMETMLLPAGQAPDPAWCLDERGVVWHRHDSDLRCDESVQRDGQWRTPTRLIARSPQFLLSELAAAGLKAIDWETYDPLEPGQPGGFRARCVNAHE